MATSIQAPTTLNEVPMPTKLAAIFIINQMPHCTPADADNTLPFHLTTIANDVTGSWLPTANLSQAPNAKGGEMARDIQGDHEDDRADMPKEPEYNNDGGTNGLAHAISGVIEPKGPHENPHQ